MYEAKGVAALGFAAGVMAAAGLLGCSRRPPHLLNAHGIELGDTVPKVMLACTDGKRRLVGSDTRLQLVTFSTMSDCSACTPHLAGLDALWQANRLPAVDQLVVAYAPTGQRTTALKAYGSRTPRPVCFDTSGVYWSAESISHTPVTVLLSRGVVVYEHDAPLGTDEERQRLIRDIDKLAASARSR